MKVLDGGTTGWYRVQYGVIIGYVSKDFVKKKSAASTASTVTTVKENLPDRVSDLGDPPKAVRVGDRNNDVVKLQKALKILGYYSGTCDGIFGEKTETAVKRFQKAKGLSQDGIAGNGTIRCIFGSSAEETTAKAVSAAASSKINYKTEKLDWFKGGSDAIPNGGAFTIKDVRTGTTFRARRLYGGNHLDAEPVTSGDTATMKRIYGGAWSWARRPILLLYGGHVYAASMNGYPHGDQAIMDNGFPGQFCIHFLNSKTHETNKVDADHQAAVKTAAASSW
jgi:peptidoglycan hydrolase-like protein with peptidoglycan-binding domain